jgi:hypothetical protein
MTHVTQLQTSRVQVQAAAIDKLEYALAQARERGALFVSIVVEYDDAVVTYQSLADSRLKAAGALALALHNFTETWEDA